MQFNKTSGLLKGVQTLVALAFASSAFAGQYGYQGDITLCTGTCDSFAALELGSDVAGGLDINVDASDSFTSADINSFSFEITSTAAPEPFDGTNPATANPLPINSAVAQIQDTVTVMGTTFTTGGTTGPDGELVDGTILFEFTVPPFSSNSAWVIFDIATGNVQVCLFFSTAGCVPGATEAVIVEGAFGLIAPADYNYDGDITLCTGTCDSFAALELDSDVTGTVGINVGSDDTFTSADIASFDFEITSTAPAEPFDGTNPATANPLPINSLVAQIQDTVTVMGTTFTTGGTTGPDGELTSGTILFEFTVPPFSSNSAWVIFDLGTGTVQVCLFFSTAGCVPGATEAVIVNGGFTLGGGAVDTDGDGIDDSVDNCTLTANAGQDDTDGDGYGNACDADFNNDCVANVIDLGILRTLFFQAGNQADLNGDGITNVIDLGIFRTLFFQTPGPSPADPCVPDAIG
ncbi:MAG: thrombospondin type 3 repeat-containing protein [Gammaproteobacteria bacterium]